MTVDEKEDNGSFFRQIKVGRMTKIFEVYKGKVPIQKNKNTERVYIPQTVYNIAVVNMQNARISAETECKGFKTILTKVYEGVFDGDTTFKNVLVNGVEFGGSNYNVTVNKNVIGKIISDKRISPEKLAVIDSIEDIIFDSNYVGSGEYIPHGMKKKKGIIRYDYFEVSVNINDADYIVTFDVEVHQQTKNYRTHKVINEIDLTPVANATYLSSTDTAPEAAVNDNSSSLSNNSISNIGKNVNVDEMNINR